MQRLITIALGLIFVSTAGWLLVLRHQPSPDSIAATKHGFSAQTSGVTRADAQRKGTGSSPRNARAAYAQPGNKSSVIPPGVASPSGGRGLGLTNLSPRKRPWSTSFLAHFLNAAVGDPIQFELVEGELASGVVKRVEVRQSEVIYLSGELAQPGGGRFFFQKQTVPGVAGDFAGIIEFPSSGTAYRIEPTGLGGTSELVERPLRSVACLELPSPIYAGTNTNQEIPPLNPDSFPTVPIPDYQDGVIVLESLPGSKPVIYLDFQGGYTPTWGGITYERSAYGNAEIRDLWKRVAEDYMPFNINVTTDLRAFQNAPQGGRQHVIITPTDTAAPGAGGVAYVGSFDWSGDTPCWAFVTNGPKYCAQACAHEAGHSLGLVHDGQQINGVHVEYYYGHGSGDTGWAPIMGVAYYQNVSQWSKGEYIDANNFQQQLAIIAAQNNVQFRVDDTGDTLATSRYLELYPDSSAGAEGLIETSGDADAFQFSTGGGDVALRADPVSASPDLGLQVGLYDSNDTLLVGNNPQATLWAEINTNLPAGTYTFRVTGSGRNDPLNSGFSPYASLGYYSITGSVANARLPNRFVVPEHAPNGTIVGIVPAANPNQHPLRYTITSGNNSGTFALDNTGTLSVANNVLLDYNTLARKTQLAVQFELFVDIEDIVDPGVRETARRVIVAVTNVNKPPRITGFTSANLGFSSLVGLQLPGGGFQSGWVNVGGLPFGATLFGEGSFITQDCTSGDCNFQTSVIEHSPPGTAIGTVLATDPDFYTALSFSILDGDSNGMFHIDGSGTITVVGDVATADQNLYSLRVAVSDQTPPVPLIATSTVSVKVVLPYPPGGISCALYNDGPGTLVSDLTNANDFPHDPASQSYFTSFEGTSGSEQGSGGGGFSPDLPGNLGGRDYGAVLRGYLLPPATGNYTFWVASEGEGELWLSSSTNPATMNRIAFVSLITDWPAPREWTKYPSQKSLPVPLAVGFAYYIEARLKASTGTNHISVAWECASNGISQAIIPGQFLSPYFMNYMPHPVGFTANLHRDAFPAALVGTVTVQDLNPNDKETLFITSGNEEGLFAFDPATGGIRVAPSASLQTASRTNYTLRVQATDNGVPPLSGATNVTINIVPAAAMTAASINLEIWTNLANSADLANLTNRPEFPKRPQALMPLANFDSGFVGFPGNWGSRLRAFLTPTNTGTFTFFLAANRNSQLKLGSATNAAGAAVIASKVGIGSNGSPIFFNWDQYVSPPSLPIMLQAGQKYYLEALQVVGGVDSGPGSLASLIPVGFFTAAWTGPGLPGTNIIDGSFLSPVDIDYAPEQVSRTVQLTIGSRNGSLVTTLAAKDSPLEALTYRFASGNLSNTFALDPISGQLRVADNTAFASHNVSDFNLVVEVQDSGYAGLYPLKSGQTLVHVQIVDNSPLFIWSGAGDSDNWSSLTNWQGGLPGDASKLSFSGVARQTNHNDLLARTGVVSLNNGGFYIWGNPLTLMGGLVNSGDNIWAIDSLLNEAETFSDRSGTLVLSGAIENDGNQLTTFVASRMRLDGVLSGSGGLVKSGPGTLILSASNTYTGPTIVSGGVLLLTNSGSVAASASIDLGTETKLDVRGGSGGFTVPAGQTLTGLGTVLVPAIVNGALSPGPFNGLTFNGKLVLEGSTILRIGRNGANSITALGGLVYGGKLTVIATDSNPPPGFGSVFKLFGSGAMPGTFKASGSFTDLTLPPLAVGLRWDITRLTVDGTISIAHDAPQIFPVTITNGTMVVQFPTFKGMHYVVEETSSLDQSARWFPLYSRSGTGMPTTFFLPVRPSAPQCFFRVRMY